MPLRLCLILLAFCLVPAVGECAAPFIGSQPAPDSEVSSGVAHLIEDCRPYLRRQFMASPALPIIDSGPRPLWSYPYDRSVCYESGCIAVPNKFRSHSGLADLSILQPSEVPSVSLPGRHVKLSLDTAGVGKWDSVLVELWITLDGCTWQLYQNTSPCDSLLVSLPGEGRFGLRVVVHNVNGLASPTPLLGEPPQLWIDVKESLSSIAVYEPVQYSGFWRTYRGADFLYSAHDFDQPADVKQAKLRRLFHPCGYIKRVESEKGDSVAPCHDPRWPHGFTF